MALNFLRGKDKETYGDRVPPNQRVTEGFPILTYGGTPSKPVDFENWATLTRLNLESRHSQLSAWWGVMYRN